MIGFFRQHGLYVLVMLIIMAVSLFFCIEKAGFHVDEIYSYGLSNSYYAPFLLNACDGTITDKTLSSQVFLDYVAATGPSVFAPDSVYYNQVLDVHPPLFYWLLNFVCSLVPGVFTKWTGLVLNLVFWVSMLVVLYRLGLRLFENRATAAFVVALYGLSFLGLSTMLYVRMYMALAFWSVLFAYVLVKLYQQPSTIYYACVFAVMFCGLLTQYFFVFYAAFASMAFVIVSLVKKKSIKHVVLYCVCVIAGGLCMLAVFPACISHMTTGFGGTGSVQEHASDISAYGANMASALKRALAENPVLFIAGAFLLIVCAVIAVMRRKAAVAPRTDVSVEKGQGPGSMHVAEGLIVVLPAFAAYVAIICIAPFASDRYIYNVVPLMCLLLGYLLNHVVQRGYLRPDGPAAAVSLTIALVLASGSIFFIHQPDYLYRGDLEKREFALEHASDPVVYFTSNVNPPISSDLPQLMLHEDCLVTSDLSEKDRISAYLGEHGDSNKLVVYMGVYKHEFSESKAIEQIKSLYGYTSVKKLWKTGCSNSFLFTR